MKSEEVYILQIPPYLSEDKNLHFLSDHNIGAVNLQSYFRPYQKSNQTVILSSGEKSEYFLSFDSYLSTDLR